jgi:hypothetical protein
MNKRALLVAVLLLVVSVCTASDDKWRALPGENCWQWLVRVGMCTTGGCRGDASMAFVIGQTMCRRVT